MAFIRWRGRCAQLLTTVYVSGRSKQILLTNLPDFYVPEPVKRCVAEKFPDIKVDWVAIARSLASGPPNILKEKTPVEHLDMAAVEQYLRKWSQEAKEINDAHRLGAAATVLTEWRARFHHNNEIDQKSNSGQFQKH